MKSEAIAIDKAGRFILPRGVRERLRLVTDALLSIVSDSPRRAPDLADRIAAP